MRPGLSRDGGVRALTGALAAALFLSAGASAPRGRDRKPKAAPVSATVTVVYDGDTVRARLEDGSERKVRLIGIDTPELDDRRPDVRFMAYVAKRYAFLKLFRRRVRLSFDWQLEDKYGRLLAFLALEDGTLFNELVLREGFASRFRSFPFEPGLMKRFEAAEAEAKREERGLWRRGDPPPIVPGEAAGELGRLVSVRMPCASVEVRKPFVVLSPSAGGLEVLVPERRRSDFPGLEAMAGKVLLVKGLVEDYKGRVQIMVDVPLQLRVLPVARVVDRPARPGL